MSTLHASWLLVKSRVVHGDAPNQITVPHDSELRIVKQLEAIDGEAQRRRGDITKGREGRAEEVLEGGDVRGRLHEWKREPRPHWRQRWIRLYLDPHVTVDVVVDGSHFK